MLDQRLMEEYVFWEKGVVCVNTCDWHFLARVHKG